jgi:hypothetical protein
MIPIGSPKNILPRCQAWQQQYQKKDCYINGKEITRLNIHQGDVLAFCVFENNQGKPTLDTRNPIYLLAGVRDDDAPVNFGSCEGVITNMSKNGDLFVS